ncbi:hypothetical protein ERO13_A02G043500v2 [Gossypium hirsutum]|uniref:UspA domain-containing protein n=6 Tax=Gossypium TaxID=3633 RepID=A0ABR0QNA0_GOSAR|nr:uncharacterized protein LOC107940131 [Gossypium hirsutum]XP_017632684.1 uncharacterized protein LOC108475211 [Gossypium arboreum]KAB2092692.1 hypothetical protein ES319_A02G047500v1 [Gossypium barbadense]TYH27232.1 hypothetical protein ES288_A02G052500v1 [Gossypium darwinii]TYI38777.1 hypothetical protein ES332_A02G052600v1 [Gossypium tomentosum]KAG4210377.1 hypothetical protein ERO13_A02G043500v2 [Gossypium hirsutum]KAK5840807.1 hypothetical protein PVK06_009712 [Gossypium arboreum]
MVTSPSRSRNVMVVVDPTPQSAAALQYALSHALVEQDKLILFYIENPSSWKNALATFLRKSSNSSSSAPNSISEGAFGTDADFLDQMRRACEVAQPKINIKIEKTDMDGKDKASVILSKSKDLRIDLIIIGQKRSLSSAILGIKRQSGSLKGQKAIDTVDYLIENSPCSCVAVQKKGQNGGYVLNSKTHKNFWLLA